MPTYVQELLVLRVAEELRGSDTAPQYLRKLARTCKDILAGKPVRKWRLERLQLFAETLGKLSLSEAYKSRGGCF